MKFILSAAILLSFFIGFSQSKVFTATNPDTGETFEIQEGLRVSVNTTYLKKGFTGKLSVLNDSTIQLKRGKKEIDIDLNTMVKISLDPLFPRLVFWGVLGGYGVVLGIWGSVGLLASAVTEISTLGAAGVFGLGAVMFHSSTKINFSKKFKSKKGWSYSIE